MLEVTALARLSGLSLPTVLSHLKALTVAYAVNIAIPFFGEEKREVMKRPKPYTFDTGFVTFVNGWNDLCDTDRGLL